MLTRSGNRTFSVADFPVARHGSLHAPGVQFRPLPIKTNFTYTSGVYIDVNNTDRTYAVEWKSLNVSNILTRQVDTCEFSFLMKFGQTFNVVVNDNIKIYDSTRLIFQGIITNVTKQHLSGRLMRVGVSAVDYTRELDGKLVAKTYQDQTVQTIIRDILIRYAPQFTTNNVNATQNVEYISFNYQTISSCFEELSDIVGYDWYVDQFKDIHFGPSSTNTAPFSLKDTNQSYVLGTLKFNDDISQIRNVIFLRGGDEVGASQTYNESADGVKSVYVCGYHFSAVPTVTVAAVSKTVGTLGIDPATSFDCLWDSKNDFIQFSTVPASAATVAITGTPLNPILMKLPHRASVATHGEKQFTIIDKTIITRDGARQRAQAEILRYAQTLSSATFMSRTYGLKAGQTLTVDSTLFGVSDTYVITQVDTSMFTPTAFQYTVTLVSTKLMDIVDLFVKLLGSKIKETAYDTNEDFHPAEFIEEATTFSETITSSTTTNATTTEAMTFSETVTNQGLNFGTIFVFGPWTPSTTKRQFNFDRSPLG